MARIRSIKPEFPHSESVGRLSRDARLLFIQLWTIADDHGRAKAAPRLLASLLYPYDDDATKLMSKWLCELEQKECIRLYEVDGNSYLDIPNWSKHQRIDNAGKSNIPEFRREPPRTAANDGESPLDLGPRKGEERIDSCAVATATRTAVDQPFDQFWKSYPKRDGANPKEPARKLFLAAVRAGSEPAAIIAGAMACALKDRDKIGTPYIPQAVKWLKDRRWEDYAASAASSTGPPPGWKPGMPTSEELRAKYERDGSNGAQGNSDQLESPAPVDEGSARLRGAEPGVFRGERRHGGAQKLGDVLSETRLVAVGVPPAEPDDRSECGVDGPLPVARVVHG